MLPSSQRFVERRSRLTFDDVVGTARHPRLPVRKQAIDVVGEVLAMAITVGTDAQELQYAHQAQPVARCGQQVSSVVVGLLQYALHGSLDLLVMGAQ